MIEDIKNNSGDYLFCHSDLNGCRMHLNSVAHRNPDKIDVEEFSKFKRVFSGHVHIRQVNTNFEFIGSLYPMDRNDLGDQKGITILDLNTGDTDFIPNRFSPVFKKFKVVQESDIDKLDEIKDTKDYIDLLISNNLLVSNRKLRRKLESLLQVGNFSSVEYLDDIVKEVEVKDENIESINEQIEISIKLDYEEFIRKYIETQKYDNEKFTSGIIEEYDEIIRIYNENFRNID
jgi:hypothetical protein